MLQSSNPAGSSICRTPSDKKKGVDFDRFIAISVIKNPKNQTKKNIRRQNLKKKCVITVQKQCWSKICLTIGSRSLAIAQTV